MVWRYCIDCKKFVEEDELHIWGISGTRENGVLVGVCKSCYGPDWHYIGEEDELIGEMVNEALDKLTREKLGRIG